MVGGVNEENAVCACADLRLFIILCAHSPWAVELHHY